MGICSSKGSAKPQVAELEPPAAAAAPTTGSAAAPAAADEPTIESMLKQEAAEGPTIESLLKQEAAKPPAPAARSEDNFAVANENVSTAIELAIAVAPKVPQLSTGKVSAEDGLAAQITNRISAVLESAGGVVATIAEVGAMLTGRGLDFEAAGRPLEPKPADTTGGAPPNMASALDKLQISGDLTTALTEEILQACKKKAAAINCPMNIAVCDAATETKGFLRMDGAWIGSIDIAMKKARTARDFNMDTRDIGPLCQPGQPLYGIEHSNQGLITFGGGVVLKNTAGTIVGAIGVSGGSVEQDHEVAAAGAPCASGGILLAKGRGRRGLERCS